MLPGQGYRTSEGVATYSNGEQPRVKSAPASLRPCEFHMKSPGKRTIPTERPLLVGEVSAASVV
jgi:hypothetical protein